MPFQETMTPRERVLNALTGKPVDRTPVSNPTNVATVELMDMVDAPFPDACRDPELAARLAATGYTELGFDSIMPYFTIIQESSALGCEMQWEDKDNWPTVRMGNPVWQGLDDIRVPSGFLKHRDNVAITESIRLLKQEFGNEVARWDGNSLELKLPGGVDRVVVDGVHFSAKVEEDLPKCALERIQVSGRVKMLPKGRVQLCVTYEEREPAVASDTVKGALGVDLNADHVAVARVSGEGRLLGVWRWDLEKHSDSVQQAARWVAGLAAELGVAVVAEDLDFRK